MKNLAIKLEALKVEAEEIIRNVISINNGIYQYCDRSQGWDESNNQLSEYFTSTTFETLLDTQYSENEEMYFWKLEVRGIYTVMVTMIDNEGTDHIFDLFQTFTETQLIGLADVLNDAIKPEHKPNPLIVYVNGRNKYDAVEVMDILNSMTREQVINYLNWNDHNGIYTDDQCEKEGIPVLTESAAKLYAMKILWEA